MVSLSNQTRLLAAQAFNKQVLEQKARARQAEIEAERQKELARTTRRLELAKASARNAVERQRIQDTINERLRSSAEKERQAKINAEAKRKSANVFTRVSKGANIGVLTGFEARKDTRGRTIGISKRESKTRLRTKSLLRTEIARQQKIAREGTDLERFLRNERAINQGQVSRAELNRQIAERKRKGLSKTPAQKRASQFFRDQETADALDRRAKRKGSPKLRATFGQLVSERARAGGLGSVPFADPVFTFGGRTRAEQVARGGTFGRRAGGESISNQLAFIGQAKSRSTSARIGFAQGLLSNLNFEGSSQSSLLSIVGNKRIKTPKTFQAELREGVGFFTTEAIPVTKAKLTKGLRGQIVARRKAEDFAKATEARKLIAKQARGTILPRARQSIFSVQALQAQPPTQISLVPQRPLTTKQKVAQKKAEAREKRAQAQAITDENRALREAGLLGFASPALVPATGRPSETTTFGIAPAPVTAPAPRGNIFDVNLTESIGIGDVLSPTPTRAQKRATKKRTSRAPTPTPRDNIFDIGSIPELDLTFGTGEPIGRTFLSGLASDVGSRVGEGVGDFFALDISEGFGSESLGAEFSFEEAFGSALPTLLGR